MIPSDFKGFRSSADFSKKSMKKCGGENSAALLEAKRRAKLYRTSQTYYFGIARMSRGE